jgi:FixJ family two-component response regulator
VDAISTAPVPANTSAAHLSADRLQALRLKMMDGSDARPIVYVIDDDTSVRDSLTNLFTSVDLRVEAFSSAVEFLSKGLPDGAVSCLVLDVRLPGPSGLDFQGELAAANIAIPIIFITGYGDIP